MISVPPVLETKPHPEARRGRSPVPIMVAVAMLAVAELIARILSPHLPGLAWGVEGVDTRVAQMQEISRSEGGVDVVFLGSSLAGAGFHPGDFVDDSARFRSAYNASIGSASGRFLEPWTLEVVVPLLDPELVVIGLTSRDVNDGNRHSQAAFSRYFESYGRAAFLGQANPVDDLEHQAALLSHLIRIRPYLRDPEALAEQIGRQEAPIGGRGESVRSGPYQPQRIREAVREGALRDFALGSIDLPALDRLVAQLGRRRIRIVLVEMPFVAEDYLPLHPRGDRDYQAFQVALRALAEKRGVQLIEAPRWSWDRGLFADFYHLNRVGMERLTNLVREEVTSSG